MSKKKGIITLVCVIAFLLAGTWTAVFGLDSAKTGSAANIKQGLDLAGGVSITYQVVGDEAPRSEDMADTIYKLQQRVDNYSTEAFDSGKGELIKSHCKIKEHNYIF